MKALKILALSLSLLSFSAAARADEAKAIFTYYNSSALTGTTVTVSILDNGLLVAKNVGRDEAGNQVVKFDDAFARLADQDLEVIEGYLATVKPGMKLRGLTREEKIRNGMCVSENAISYRAGDVVVAQNYGCTMLTLQDKRAARAAKAVMATLDNAVSESSARIFGQ